ncbi:hypothetical protein EG327_010844 [Venturia inaequalis]|uniref:Uncharacterized protein n=1 Tax=Venturia inaequalis TaxID=5025 RepID=A0A8H3ZA37_VENIN|nr:hypothetical protein EG327_010844 [Venturia inaequalis]
MKVKELQARWLNGRFYCPPRDEWNGTFKTPSEINGAPISQIKNFITVEIGAADFQRLVVTINSGTCLGATIGLRKSMVLAGPAVGTRRGTNQNAADQAEDTTTISARHGEFIRLAGNFAISDHITMREKAAEDEVAVQEEGEQGRNEKTNEKGPRDYSVLEPGSSLNVGKDAVTGAEESEGQEPPELDPKPAASVAMDELKPAFRKKRSRNNNPTKAINKAKKQAEKKVAQEEQLKRGHGKAPKHKKGQKRAY